MAEKKPVQQILIIVSILAFVGSTGLMAAGLFRNSGNNSPQSTNETPADAATQNLLVAEEGFQKVLEREPDNLFALQNLVSARIELGKVKEAIPPLEKLVELEPENQEALQILAAAHIQTGNPNEAIPYIEKLVALNPENAQLKDQLTQVKQQIEAGTQEDKAKD
ncbi:tetratricopeptide repeat protein [Lusitaniella coriacea LEGE 07157]|uniref:peptidylprolyl isomerase n=1 Tax=Lusitaniella coriacea LEGE 07157 TaxID=945747 RepID=A0A8J7DVS4_9CYAN|nr:tetratricopeptide repeat protein [Lusitaniella coriacea]MBE9115972.1 tetratricopeptide repeat protein [Lusitaniella coriacea LEGE 07157]